MFYQDLFNCMIAWWKSRRWWRMGLLSFFPLILLLTSMSMVLYGFSISSQTLASRYFELVHDDVEASFQAMLKPNTSAIQSPSESTVMQTTSGDPVPHGNSESGLAGVSDSAESEAVQSGASEVEGGDSTSRLLTEERRVQVPLRRILQLGNYNPRVAYVVANQMARQGRLGMASRMMREIAPQGKEGFAYAYAWMAEYAMMSWKGTDAQASSLLADLEAAERGGANLTSAQLRNFCSLLVHFKRPQDGITLLRNYAPRYPELNVMLANLSKQTGHTGVEFQEALDAGRKSFQAKREAGELNIQDWFQAVQIEILGETLDQALALAQAGFKANPKSPEIRRLFSDVLLAKHQSLVAGGFQELETTSGVIIPAEDAAEVDETEKVDDPSKQEFVDGESVLHAKASTERRVALPNLRYLEAACKVDSANPAIVPEVAKAMSLGHNLTPALKMALESSLADGTASGITHLILANSILTGPTPEKALPHLRLALNQMPNSPQILNNLAFALMKYDPENLPEAQQLVERALSIPGGSIPERASMLDTLGEIRMIQGETLKAIELFEQAIELDGNKLVTRSKLVDAYRKVGMSEMAEAQQRRIGELGGPTTGTVNE